MAARRCPAAQVRDERSRQDARAAAAGADTVAG